MASHLSVRKFLAILFHLFFTLDGFPSVCPQVSCHPFPSFLHFGWLPICLSSSFLPSLSIFSSLWMASHDPTPRLTYHAGRILYSLSPHSPHNASPRGSPHHIYAKQGHPFGNAPTIIAYSAYLLHLFS